MFHNDIIYSIKKGSYMSVQEINDVNELDLLLKNNDYVLVDFYGQACQPCKIVATYIDDVASELKSENVAVIKIDAGKLVDLSVKFGIRSVPTFVLLDKDGEDLATKIGMGSKEQLVEFVKNNI